MDTEIVGSSPISHLFVAVWCSGSTRDFDSRRACSNHVTAVFTSVAQWNRAEDF